MKSDATIPIIALSISANTQQALGDFFRAVESMLMDFAFVVIQSEENYIEEPLLLHLLSTSTNHLKIEIVKSFTTLSPAHVYCLNTAQQFMLTDRAIVPNNQLNISHTGFVGNFWQSLAAHHSQPICLALEVTASIIKEMSVAKDAGGTMILHQATNTPLNDNVSSYLTEFDFILSIDEMAAIILKQRALDNEWGNSISKNKSYQFVNHAHHHTTYVTEAPKIDYSTTYLKQLAYQHFLPIVIFVDEFERVVHIEGNAQIYFSLPNHYKKQSIKKVFPQHLSSIILGVLSTLYNNHVTPSSPIIRQQYTVSINQSNYALHLEAHLIEGFKEDTHWGMIKLDFQQLTATLQETVKSVDAYDEPLHGSWWTQTEMPSEEEAITEENDRNYRAKINELGELNDDLNNLLQSSDIGTLFLDDHLRVRKFTNSIRRYIKIGYQDIIGRPLAELPLDLTYPNLLADAQKVLQSQQAIEREIAASNDQWFQIRLHPYRTAENTINGLVITFLDVSYAHKLRKRLDLLSAELEKQGLELLRAIMDLREEAEVNDMAATQMARQNNILESVLNSMSDGLFAIDMEGTFFMMNKMAHQITGMNLHNNFADWCKTLNILDSLSKKPLSSEANPLLRIQRMETIDNNEFYLIRQGQQQGSYISLSALPLTDVEGNLFGMVIAIRDISQRKQAEIELLNSEQTKRALLNALPDTLFRLNHKGIFLDYIPARRDSYIPAAAFVGNSIKDALPIYFAEGVLEALDKVLQTGREATHTCEVLEDDLFHFYEARLTPVNPEEVMCIVRDITETVIAEEAIQKSEMYYNQLIKLNPSPVVIHSKDGKVLDINPAALALLQMSDISEFGEKTIFSFLSASERSRAKNVVKRAYTDAMPKGIGKFSVTRMDGTKVTVEATGAIMPYQNRLVIQVVMREISEGDS